MLITGCVQTLANAVIRNMNQRQQYFLGKLDTLLSHDHQSHYVLRSEYAQLQQQLTRLEQCMNHSWTEQFRTFGYRLWTRHVGDD